VLHTATITIQASHPIRTFNPALAFGAGVDGHEEGEISRVYTPANLAAMRSSGLGALTYRLRTELGIEAWHWNPRGHWSDAAHHQGYWVSDSTSAQPITTCYGYKLPRRGSTVDQAGNDGYSRLDDGDTASFWKTNPYLDEHFTGESDTLHPQWAVIDLGKSLPIDTVRLSWGVPFATQYRLEYWSGSSEIGENDSGTWHLFPRGTVKQGQGGEVSLRLAQRAIKTRFVRLWLTVSSHSAPPGSTDIRDRLGYSLREIQLGYTDARGRFHDAIRHAPSNARQTKIYASSCDSWHREQDRDPRVEQPGFDLIVKSGLTNGLPVLMPVGVLYDNPENAWAEMAYLRARGLKLRGVELGEEADGQMVSPADYGALYRQFARAIRGVEPRVALGGPSFQSVELDYLEWPEPPAKGTWLGRVLNYLGAHGERASFRFCSFEWYPFDDVLADTAPLLHGVDHLLDDVLARMRAAGLPAGFPFLMTEYGYSAFGGQPEVDLPGMLFNADSACHFLEAGGETAYLYGYEPGSLINEVPASGKNAGRAWGNNMLFLADDEGRIQSRMPTYYGAVLLTKQWAQPGGGRHEMLRNTIQADTRDKAALHVYTVRRPDGQLAALLLNEDPKAAMTVHLRLDGSGASKALAGPVDLFQYSARQYRWHPREDQGYAWPDAPPEQHHFVQAPGVYSLPPFSMTVIRGR
jgi:hypothetical protein